MLKQFLKILFLTIIMISPLGNLIDAQSKLLNIGDTVYTYMQKHPVKYRLSVNDISTWIEGTNVKMLTYQNGIDSTKPNILSHNGIPFGVLEGAPPHAYYLFDTDGDGALDYKTDEAIVPIWFVSYNSKIIDSTSSGVKIILDTFYNSFQSDSGLIVTARTQSAFTALINSAKDSLVVNRDLIYQLYYYLIMTERDPAQALLAIQIMEKTYLKRFGSIHPIIKLYELESAIQLGEYNLAESYLKYLDPNFIPAKYYSYILEKDSTIKSEKLSELKRLYSNHWIVKNLK